MVIAINPFNFFNPWPRESIVRGDHGDGGASPRLFVSVQKLVRMVGHTEWIRTNITYWSSPKVQITWIYCLKKQITLVFTGTIKKKNDNIPKTTENNEYHILYKHPTIYLENRIIISTHFYFEKLVGITRPSWVKSVSQVIVLKILR